jgi:hypothetical protein
MKGSCIRLEKAQVKAWLHEFKTPYLNMVRNWFKILAGLPMIARLRGLSDRYCVLNSPFFAGKRPAALEV